MDTNTELLRRWADGNPVTIDDLGGPTALIDRKDLAEAHLLRVVQNVGDLWDELEDRRQDAARVLIDAAAADDIEFVSDVHDELLRNADVISAIHTDLEKVVRLRANESVGIFADIAAETWTRLALAGWCGSLTVCGRLVEMATAAAQTGSTTSYLVRAVGAALQRWGYDDLRIAMTTLRTVEEYESDADFELGLHQLGLACVATDKDFVLARLRESLLYFEAAEKWEGRPDARAYLESLGGLLRFMDGGVVTENDVTRARMVVSEYLLGYRGLARHWRQGRADLASGWAQLLVLLRKASEGAEAAWFDPSSIIEGAASLLIADTTLTLIARGPDDTTKGIITLVEPRIADTFRNQQPSQGFIDRWLEVAGTATEPDTQMIDAVHLLKASIERGDAHPKAHHGLGSSSPASAPIDVEEFRSMYHAHTGTLNLTQEALARRIFGDIQAIVPQAVADVSVELVAVVSQLVRFTSHYLGLRESGSRSVDWLVGGRDTDGHFPGEHKLSDALRQWFAPSFEVTIEAPDVAGGFADVVVRFPQFVFFIEVKRVEKNWTNERLVEEYGDQTTQYSVSDIPIVFLAVLDYAERITRVDLDGTMWTITHRHPGATRDYALTGVRIQANTASPSVASALSLTAKRALHASQD